MSLLEKIVERRHKTGEPVIHVRTDLLQLRDTMLAVLTEAAKYRHERENVIGVGPHAELGWVLYEREQLTNMVNIARANRGLPSLATSDIRQVEQLAEGHSNYAGKFALYCAEAVFKDSS